MSYSKRQIIEEAFNEIGLATYEFDLSPDQLQSAARKLDAMMLAWDAKGIQLGYPFAMNPQDIDIDQDSFIPPESYEAAYLNLALRIAPGFGKTISQETKINAKMAYDGLLALAAFPREQQMPGTMPAGAGNKPWRRYDDNFLRRPDDGPIFIDPNGQLDFGG